MLVVSISGSNLDECVVFVVTLYSSEHLDVAIRIRYPRFYEHNKLWQHKNIESYIIGDLTSVTLGIESLLLATFSQLFLALLHSFYKTRSGVLQFSVKLGVTCQGKIFRLVHQCHPYPESISLSAVKAYDAMK